MKVRELIKLLKEENPEAELYTHSGVSMDAFKIEGIKSGFTNNNDWMITHSEWAYVDDMYKGNGLSNPIVLLEEDV